MFPDSLKPISTNLRMKHFREHPSNGGVYYSLGEECQCYSSSEGVVKTSKPEMFTVGSGDVPVAVPRDQVDKLVYERLMMHVTTMKEHGNPKLGFLKTGPGVMRRKVENGKRHHWLDCVLWAEAPDAG